MEQDADLFEDGNVEGSSDKKVCCERGIVLQEATNVEVVQTLSWAVDTVIAILKADSGRPSRFGHAFIKLHVAPTFRSLCISNS